MEVSGGIDNHPFYAEELVDPTFGARGGPLATSEIA